MHRVNHHQIIDKIAIRLGGLPHTLLQLDPARTAHTLQICKTVSWNRAGLARLPLLVT
jgi:hypothetical protein